MPESSDLTTKVALVFSDKHRLDRTVNITNCGNLHLLSTAYEIKSYYPSVNQVQFAYPGA